MILHRWTLEDTTLVDIGRYYTGGHWKMILQWWTLEDDTTLVDIGR